MRLLIIPVTLGESVLWVPPPFTRPAMGERLCELMKRVKEVLERGEGEIPAASFALFHVKRAAELAGCGGDPQPEGRPPERWDEERLFRERGIIVE